MTNGALMAGIAQVETGLSHCWSEATWACQGPYSSSCGGAVIAGSADGPCSSEQGGLGMFQFDGGTYSQTIARDGEEVLLLEGNITHAVEFVAARVEEEVSGVNSYDQAIAWLNAIPIQTGNAQFEEWIEILACRYNGCCGCSSQEAKYRDATVGMVAEFEVGFWSAEPPVCEPIPAAGATLEEDDDCATAGGASQYWRLVDGAGHGGSLKWTHATDSSSAENYGQWNLDFEVAGTYRLEVATDGGTYAESQQTAYHIRAGGAETVVVIDQSAVDGFQLLAEVDFAAGGGQWVRFDDNTGEPVADEVRIAFDALRIVPVTEEEPEDPEEPGDPDDPNDPDNPDNPADPGDPDERDRVWITGGCQSAPGSNGGASLLVIILGALIVARRRR